MKRKSKIIILAMICLITLVALTGCGLMPYFTSDNRVRVVGDSFDTIVGVFGDKALVSRNDRFFLIRTDNGRRASDRFDVISGTPSPGLPFFGARSRGINYVIDARTGGTIAFGQDSVHRTRGQIMVAVCDATGMSYMYNDYRNTASGARPRLLYVDATNTIREGAVFDRMLEFYGTSFKAIREVQGQNRVVFSSIDGSFVTLEGIGAVERFVADVPVFDAAANAYSFERVPLQNFFRLRGRRPDGTVYEGIYTSRGIQVIPGDTQFLPEAVRLVDIDRANPSWRRYTEYTNNIFVTARREANEEGGPNQSHILQLSVDGRIGRIFDHNNGDAVIQSARLYDDVIVVRTNLDYAVRSISHWEGTSPVYGTLAQGVTIHSSEMGRDYGFSIRSTQTGEYTVFDRQFREQGSNMVAGSLFVGGNFIMRDFMGGFAVTLPATATQPSVTHSLSQMRVFGGRYVLAYATDEGSDPFGVVMDSHLRTIAQGGFVGQARLVTMRDNFSYLIVRQHHVNQSIMPPVPILMERIVSGNRISVPFYAVREYLGTVGGGEAARFAAVSTARREAGA